MSRLALVIGAEGFAGQHLMRHLADRGETVIGTSRVDDGDGHLPLDITDREAVNELLRRVCPASIYHLAAITFVPTATANPLDAFDVNFMGALAVLEAARSLSSPPRLLFISSGEVYGHVHPADVPLSEESGLAPRTPYAAAKAALEMALRGYLAGRPGPEILVARAFNHTGPGQAPQFVCSDFARQVARIEQGQAEPIMRVGNLAAERDFSDVRDVVRAYRALMADGEPGGVYNVASGQSRSIQSILDGLLDRSKVKIQVEVDPDRLRRVDVPVLAGDISRLRQRTGWQPEIPFDQTLDDLLEFWRVRSRAANGSDRADTIRDGAKSGPGEGM